MGKRIEHMFVEKDENDDGKLSLEELASGDRADRLFARADKNGDGAISEEEMQAMKAMGGKRGNKGKRWQQPSE